VMAEEMH